MAEWLRRMTDNKATFLLWVGTSARYLFIFYFSHLAKKTLRQSDMFRSLGEKIWSVCITWRLFRHTWFNYRHFRALSKSAVCNPNDVMTQWLVANQRDFRFETWPFLAQTKAPSPADTCMAEKYLITSEEALGENYLDNWIYTRHLSTIQVSV